MTYSKTSRICMATILRATRELTVPQGISKLKNVTLHHMLTRGGDDTWMLTHADGWRDPYFDYFATHLLKTKQSKFNTREKYCRFAAAFVDYMIEAASWYRENMQQSSLTNKYRRNVSSGPNFEMAGPALVEFIEIYPKVLAGGAHSGDPIVVELSKRLGREVYKHKSQRLHIQAVNLYLELSESFNSRMHQSGLKDIHGMPLFTDASLFPHVGGRTEISPFQRIALSNKSMIGGVVAGGPRLKRLAALKPAVVDEDVEDHYDFDSAFPIEDAPNLITSGFETYRDRALYCLLMASGVRISEALSLTWFDVDPVNRKVFIRNPSLKSLKEVYWGFLTHEQRKKLPWKGRTHSLTLLIEPFATEFWRLLQLYMDNEMIATESHPFVFQKLKGNNIIDPLIFTDHSNLRTTFTNACAKIGLEDSYSPHTLRHMYGVYCFNYWPNSDGTYGLPPAKVQYLMGHFSMESTMNYAKPDTVLLAAEQRINASVLDGFAVEDRGEIRVKVLEQMLEKAEAEVKKNRAEKRCKAAEKRRGLPVN